MKYPKRARIVAKGVSILCEVCGCMRVFIGSKEQRVAHPNKGKKDNCPETLQTDVTLLLGGV